MDFSSKALTSSTRHPGKWILPAGTLEIGETPEGGAVRETEEEAGVSGYGSYLERSHRSDVHSIMNAMDHEH